MDRRFDILRYQESVCYDFADGSEHGLLDRDDPVPEKPGEDEYARLPRSLQLAYTREEYLWLSDNEKGTLAQRECEPDVFVD